MANWEKINQKLDNMSDHELVELVSAAFEEAGIELGMGAGCFDVPTQALQEPNRTSQECSIELSYKESCVIWNSEYKVNNKATLKYKTISSRKHTMKAENHNPLFAA